MKRPDPLKEFIMTVRYTLLSRSVSTAVFVVSLILTAATLNSVVAAAGAVAPQTIAVAAAETAGTQG